MHTPKKHPLQLDMEPVFDDDEQETTTDTDRIEQLLKERDVALAALQRISESAICWQDGEANALLEGIGIIANNAVNEVFQMEGMNQ